MDDSCAADKGIGLFTMLCVTLTLANRVPAETAAQTIDQLVTSLNVHPDAVGGDVSAFKAIGQRQVQGCLGSADETVGFILSAARSATWGVHLALVEAQGESWTSSADGICDRQLQEHALTSGKRSLHAPGGVTVELAREGSFYRTNQAPELGPIESTLQLLCAIERRRSEEGQEAGLMINAGRSQTQAAQLLGVSQQAVSARLQAGYWYESRKVAYWLANQIEQLITKTS
jgi:DNA-binding XRE family transcriptional regulator